MFKSKYVISFFTFLQYAVLTIILTSITVSSDDAAPIPEVKAEVQAWFDANVKPLADRKGSLNADLEAAEATPKTIKVRADGSGEFKTITDAVKSIPAKNTQRVIVDIGPGTYTEKVTIERDKPFISFIGPPDKATIEFAGTANEYGTVYSATLQVDADFFVAKDLIIKNSAPKPDGTRPGAQAVAFRIGGNMATFYNCKFIGFQDTVCDDKGFHFFKDCYIEGTVDFIFGSGKSIYLTSEISVLPDNLVTVITAQARGNAEDTGFSFVHCAVTGTAKGAFLGRAWMPAPKTVFAFSTISEVIGPEGWSNNEHPEREPEIFFGEFKNTGPGAAPAGRAKFSKQLTDAEVKPFITLAFIEGSKWLLPPPKL